MCDTESRYCVANYLIPYGRNCVKLRAGLWDITGS